MNKKEKVNRDAFVWNTASGLLMASQSVVMLMVLMRVCDVVQAGIFTLAYANANLFLCLGKYGMRNYQVSDVDGLFAYSEYSRSRLVTTIAMLLVGAGYLGWAAISQQYSLEKSIVILVMLLFKGADSFEDVYMGNCQQHGRLDVAAKALTGRIASTLVVYSIGVMLLGNQIAPLVVATCYTYSFCIGERIWLRKRFDLPSCSAPGHGKGVLVLLKTCLPLFLASFLMFYIGNAPKYAIDALLDDSAQAYYGFIAMPVFVVGLLSGFVYNPEIKSLADCWTGGAARSFLKRFGRLAVIVMVITALCDLGALYLGVPILNALYNTRVDAYLFDLIILVTGGGFLALASLFTVGITIMRKQTKLLVGYGAASLAATILSPLAVQSCGIDGAAFVYLALMGVLSMWFGLVLIIEARACFVGAGN